jgi:hypothetical protein
MHTLEANNTVVSHRIITSQQLREVTPLHLIGLQAVVGLVSEARATRTDTVVILEEYSGYENKSECEIRINEISLTWKC